LESLQTKKINCSICETPMKYSKKEECWRCPTCKAWFYVDERRVAELLSEQKAKEAEEEFNQKLRWSLSRLKLYPKPQPGGGGKGKVKGGSKSGKKRKKPLKRLKPYEFL